MEQKIETTILYYVGNVRVRASAVVSELLGWGHVCNVRGMFFDFFSSAALERLKASKEC